MAKKRKTRRDKERAAARRQSTKTHEDSLSSQQPSSETVTDIEAKPQDEAVINSPEDMERHKERMGTMRLSLIVFGVLVLTQISLWILEYLDVIALDFISL